MSLEQIKNNIIAAGDKIKERTVNVLGIEAMRSVEKNFREEGRPKWKPSKKPGKLKGTKTLRVSGNMSRISINIDVPNAKVKLITNSLARAYSRIHQEGGTINHPGGKRKIKKSKSGRSVFASSGAKRFVDEKIIKPYKITIPARPWLVIPPEDFPGILKQIERSAKL